VPSLAIGPMKLDVQNVFMILPCLIEHETVFAGWVFVEDRFVERGFVSHRVKNAVQEPQELAAPLRHDLKLDNVSNWHLISQFTRPRAEIHDLTGQNR
jgi:hypothetical protein